MHPHMLCSGAAAAVAARRVRNILGSVLGRDARLWRPEVRLLSTSSGKHVGTDQRPGRGRSDAGVPV